MKKEVSYRVQFIDLLFRIMVEFPQLRIGQILDDGLDTKGLDLFYLSDERLLELLTKYYNSIKLVKKG